MLWDFRAHGQLKDIIYRVLVLWVWVCALCQCMLILWIFVFVILYKFYLFCAFFCSRRCIVGFKKIQQGSQQPRFSSVIVTIIIISITALPSSFAPQLHHYVISSSCVCILSKDFLHLTSQQALIDTSNLLKGIALESDSEKEKHFFSFWHFNIWFLDDFQFDVVESMTAQHKHNLFTFTQIIRKYTGKYFNLFSNILLTLKQNRIFRFFFEKNHFLFVLSLLFFVSKTMKNVEITNKKEYK